LHVADSTHSLTHLLTHSLTQYINCNMQTYLTKRLYKDCLPKSHLQDGSLNSVPIWGIWVEGRDAYWTLGQQWTWTNKDGRWQGFCQGQKETSSSITGGASLSKWSRHKVRMFGVKNYKISSQANILKYCFKISIFWLHLRLFKLSHYCRFRAGYYINTGDSPLTLVLCNTYSLVYSMRRRYFTNALCS
jgi:hypothetical protein